MADGNGVLRAGDKARAVASMLTVATVGGGILFATFALGVRYATSDVRTLAASNAIKNAEQDTKIELVEGRQIDTNLMLLYLSESMLADPELTSEQRSALKKMREVYAGVRDWK